jgi:hypothetical protein
MLYFNILSGLKYSFSVEYTCIASHPVWQLISVTQLHCPSVDLLDIRRKFFNEPLAVPESKLFFTPLLFHEIANNSEHKLYYQLNNIHKNITRLWLLVQLFVITVQYFVIIVQFFVITVQFFVITVQFSVTNWSDWWKNNVMIKQV